MRDRKGLPMLPLVLIPAAAATAAPAAATGDNPPASLLAAIGSVLTVALAGAMLWVGRIMKARLERVLDQTENSHSNAEHPNLRDELTATRQAAESARDFVQTVQQELRDHRSSHDRSLEGVRSDIRAVGTRLDDHIRDSSMESAAQRAVGAALSPYRLPAIPWPTEPPTAPPAGS